MQRPAQPMLARYAGRATRDASETPCSQAHFRNDPCCCQAILIPLFTARSDAMKGRPFDSRPLQHRRRRVALGLVAGALVVLYIWHAGGGTFRARARTRGLTGEVVWTGWPEQRLPTAENPARRASWGALRQQGPAARLKENLRADKKYLTCFPSNG
jgi:hypothetical protein